MNFEYTPPQTDLEKAFGGHHCINLFGPIQAGDDERFLEFIAACGAPPRADLYIDSIGGDVDAAINIGRIVRDNWFSTHVGSYFIDRKLQYIDEFLVPRKFIDGVCMSAATLLYIGGRLRYLSKGARFGVHQFSFRNPNPDLVGKSQILSSRIARYIADMGIGPDFLEISASVEAKSIRFIEHDKMRSMSIVTDGETPVVWSVEARNRTIYIKGERDSLYGHHKILLTFARPDFLLHGFIESQGREEHLTNFPLVEIVICESEEKIIDVSERCIRFIYGAYTNIIVKIEKNEASELVNAVSFGLRVRGGPDAPMFLGIAPMPTKAGEDMLQSFIHCLL